MTISVLYNGDDAVLTATCYTDATMVTPLNLTGITAATFMLKRNLTDADASALITKKLAAGIVVTNAMGGVLTITLAAADTAALPTTQVSASLKIKDSTNKTVTVYNDALTLQQTAVQVAV